MRSTLRPLLPSCLRLVPIVRKNQVLGIGWAGARTCFLHSMLDLLKCPDAQMLNCSERLPRSD